MNTDKIYAEQLANEYAPKDTSKVVALRKLDAKAKLPATVFTYTFGIITALVAGVGMCLSMKVIGSGSTTMFVLGVIVGIIGLGCSVMCLHRFHYVCYRCDSAVCKNATKRNNERCLTT